VETSVTVRVAFDAGHSIKAIEREFRNHGHHWTVAATIAGEPDPATGWPRGSETLLGALEELTAELNLRNLDEMLPGVVTSPLFLAAQFLEMLAQHYPRISAVEVDCSDGTSGRVVRSPRQQ
jgi:6-pyruvoyl-tetrahydropterin synthase